MPRRNLTLSARTDRRFIRSTYQSNRFVLAEIVAPHAHQNGDRKRPTVNLAFVLDRSGSMAGEKIRLAKQAVEQSIARLQSDDRFSIVVYDNVVGVVFPSALATPENRAAALGRLAEIRERDATNLAEGWLRGCEQVGLNLSAEGVNRALLLTDGLANVGTTDRDQLAMHAAELRLRGISTTTFGVGTDFDEVLLQAMATAGGGNFYYIAQAGQIADYVTSEVGETLDIVARDVVLNVTAPDGVGVETLTPFPIERLGGGQTRVTLGPLVAEQVVQIMLRLNFPFGASGRETGATLSLTDRDGLADGASASLGWEYAEGKINDLQERDVEVDRVVARVFAARARQEATSLNRSGDYSAARAALGAVAKRVSSYAGRDSEMRGLVAELERDASSLAAPMPAAALKEMHFRGYTAAKMRSADGTAYRRTAPGDPKRA